MDTKQIRTLQVLNVLAFLIMIAVNVMAVVIPLNGIDTAEVSNRYQNLFTPAGITFSVWSVIYVWLLVFTVVQARRLKFPADGATADVIDVHQRIGYRYVAACLLNAAWLFAWHYEQLPLSMAIMVLLFGVLFSIHSRLQGVRKVFTVKAPLSIFFGWITVAMLANLMVILTWLSTTNTWIDTDVMSHVMLALAALIACAIVVIRRDLFYAAVVLWAFSGIAIRHINGTPSMLSGAIAAGVMVLITAVYVIAKARRS